MRPTLIIIFGLFCSNVFALNWQMFPPDSLRYYINPVQDSVFIQGIDYRQYEQYNDTTEIDLGWFARLDTISQTWIAQIKTANSSFGRKVFETERSTTLIFVDSYNGAIKLGQLDFPKIRTPGYGWKVFENVDLLIEGRISSLALSIDKDSICKMVLNVTRKSDGFRKVFEMTYGKRFGITKCPVFYDILAFPKKLEQIGSVTIHKYTEFSEEDFFEIIPGTELHYVSGNYKFNEFKTEKWTFLKYDNNEGFFQTTVEGKLAHYTSNPPDPRPIFSHWETFRQNDAIVIKPRVTSSRLYNPIPNKYRPNTDSFFVENSFIIPKYSVNCGRLVKHQFDTEQLSSEGGLNDTNWFWSESFHISKFMQGIGQIEFLNRISGRFPYSIYFELKYLFIPGVCEIGNYDWRLTSVTQELSYTNLLYPNPASSIINIEAQCRIIRVNAISSSGQLHELTLNNDRANIEDLSPGIYVIQIETESRTIQKKLLVE